MENLFTAIGMVAGLGAGKVALVSSGKQPENAMQLRGLRFLRFRFGDGSRHLHLKSRLASTVRPCLT